MHKEVRCSLARAIYWVFYCFFKGSKVEIGMDMSCDVHTVQPLISMRTVVKYVILTR